MSKLCKIYKSPRKELMYLYVDREEDLARVPAGLLEKFGKPELVTTLPLSPERRLARANAADVLESISKNGYYLQMPPTRDTDMAQVADRNEKLERR